MRIGPNRSSDLRRSRFHPSRDCNVRKACLSLRNRTFGEWGIPSGTLNSDEIRRSPIIYGLDQMALYLALTAWISASRESSTSCPDSWRWLAVQLARSPAAYKRSIAKSM